MVNFNVVAKRQVRDASVSEATDLKNNLHVQLQVWESNLYTYKYFDF